MAQQSAFLPHRYKLHGIEIVSKRPSTPTGKPPLILVHGAWHGAWCWDMGFMDRLVEHGFECHALSLAGHDGSDGRGLRFRDGIIQYVDNVRQVMASLDRAPVLIGHSMGGFVVQKCLETESALAGVLMASVPPTGILPFFFRLARRDPKGVAKALSSLTCKPVMEGEARVARLLFSQTTSSPIIRYCAARLQDEPFRAFLDMLLFMRTKPCEVSVPVHVLGAGRDALFPVHEAKATALAFGTEAYIFDHMGHDMMLDTGWEAVVDHLARWIDALRCQLLLNHPAAIAR